MQFRSIIISIFLMITSGLPAFAQSERAVFLDFDNNDRRSDGSVVWRTEQVKTADGRDDLAIRADVDIPSRSLKLKILLSRNLDPTLPASHLIELTFTVPPDFVDGGMGDVIGVNPMANELSRSEMLLSSMFRTRTVGKYVEALSDKPGDICYNLAVLNNNDWLSIYFSGAKRHLLQSVSDKYLAISKGDAGQRVFAAVFAAWEKTSEAGVKSAVCQPS